MPDTKNFNPDEELKAFMYKKLNLTKQMNEIDAAGQDLSEEIDTQNKRLATKQVRILDDIVFPSMANLVFFFKMVEHPELQESFDNPIKDLLGVRRNNPRDIRYGFAFISLIRSMLNADNRQKKEKKEDFRLILTAILQEIIDLKVNNSLPDMFKDRNRFHMIFDDLTRAVAWTGMLAHDVKDEYDLVDDKRYQKDIESNSPHRTFPFIEAERSKKIKKKREKDFS
jgi:hypothetical protein